MLRRRHAGALMGRVSRPALQLWFEFASTYSHPAVQRIEALASFWDLSSAGDRPRHLRQDAHALVGRLEAGALVGALEVDLHGQHVRARGRRRGRTVAAVEPGLDRNPAPG